MTFVQIVNNNRYESHVFFSNVPILSHQYTAERIMQNSRVYRKNVTPSVFVCLRVLFVLQHVGRRSKSQRATSRLPVTPTDILRTHTASGEYLLHQGKR